jgi:hypothetical protein
MTEIVPTPAAVPSAPESGEDAGFEVMRSDAVLTGRAMSSAEFLAGLIAAAELDTVGSPRKLPTDLFPDLDPVAVQRVWERALVVGVRAGRLMGAPRFHRDQLARLRGELMEAGHVAMGGLVGRSLSAVERAPEWHPVDGETGREH